nr:nitroreductase [uncultured Faecalibacillus sp.]
MNTYESILTRRSTRKYLNKPVSKELLEKIIETGRYAPSGGNSQSNHFIVIQNKQIIDRLVKMVEKAFSKMEITENMYRSLQNSINLSKKGGYVFSYNAPVLIIVANKRDYGNNQADCAIALENMMLEANELDLGSCYINQLKWLNEDQKILSYLQSLGMNEDERVYDSLIVGYPDTNDGKPLRKVLPRKGNEVTWL